ncbi:MAG TPA: hypothetical protein VE309_00400, partial [Caulobacteraceae bacterium]|nr:hypothetical protein [Caulobacteraceae bacterium]
PLLDALFALHDGRLRPFHKYLQWELETWPLERMPWPPGAFLDKLLAILETADRDLQRQMLAAVETLFRAAGHHRVFDGWGPSLPAMTSGRL